MLSLQGTCMHIIGMEGQRRSKGDDDDDHDVELKKKKTKKKKVVAQGEWMGSAVDAKAIGGGGGGDCVALSATDQGGELVMAGFPAGCEDWRWGMAGEEMWWGSIWEPFWDVEFVGEAYNALFGDVVWDMDVWNLNAIQAEATPNSLPAAS